MVKKLERIAISIVEGAVMAFGGYAHQLSFRRRRGGVQDDVRAMRHDFEMVGADMRRAMNKANGEAGQK